ncbi:hypothetical protein CYMTET_17036 [Cymbomonas tetramitiformis]|uniref:Uncharacterized protein n=1 Tax=Cymbomonas tetramitiformis TaxID=36881 RepID=A0AAE0GC96_9CHLO|nr:hypothetical protein CYMTET_30686 [Cymbomonas tetramitiformis]KAK3274806.1 hypothetical protein CYMTET_17036 [Cymbomonas tetramitiformis]
MLHLKVAWTVYKKLENNFENVKQCLECPETLMNCHHRFLDAVNSLYILISLVIDSDENTKKSCETVKKTVYDVATRAIQHLQEPTLEHYGLDKFRIATFYIYFVVCSVKNFDVELETALEDADTFRKVWIEGLSSRGLFIVYRPVIDEIPLGFVYALLSVWNVNKQSGESRRCLLPAEELFKVVWDIVLSDKDTDNINQPLSRKLYRDMGFSPCVLAAIRFLMDMPKGSSSGDCFYVRRYMKLLYWTRFKEKVSESVMVECIVYVCLKGLYIEEPGNPGNLSSALSLLRRLSESTLFTKNLPEKYLNMTAKLEDSVEKRLPSVNAFLKQYTESPIARLLDAMMKMMRVRKDGGTLSGNQSALLGNQDYHWKLYKDTAMGDIQAYTDSFDFVSTLVTTYSPMMIMPDDLKTVQTHFITRRSSLVTSGKKTVDMARAKRLLQILGKRPRSQT